MCKVSPSTRAAGLIAWLASGHHDHDRSNLPAIVFAYAARQRNSWAARVLDSLAAFGAQPMAAWGVGPGARRQVGRRWTQQNVYPAVQRTFVRECRRQVMSLPSLAEYQDLHPTHGLDNLVHSRRIPFQDAREWGLARCGHHWFGDGHLSRHAGRPESCMFCGAPDGSLAHALLACPGFADLRQRWLSTCNLQEMPPDWSFMAQELFAGPRNASNSIGQVADNVRFVATACRRVGAAVAGLP